MPTSTEWTVTVTVRFDQPVESAYAEGIVRTMLDGNGRMETRILGMAPVIAAPALSDTDAGGRVRSERLPVQRPSREGQYHYSHSTRRCRQKTGLPALTARDVMAKLGRAGFALDRMGRGSHQKWCNSLTERHTTIPNHRGTLPKGTLRAIIAQAGMTVEEFLEL